MYLMYVDESGDPGLNRSPTRYFVLSGMVMHELNWLNCLNTLIDFRKKLYNQFGLHLRTEIHSAAMINNPDELIHIKRNDRLAILRSFADMLSTMNNISIINIVVDKQDKTMDYNVFENSWRALLQRFETTINNKNFSGPSYPNECGMIFPDHTDPKKLRELMRKMRRYNPVPHQQSFGGGFRNIVLTSLIEDPNFRDSAHSYFIQAVDLIAYLLYQRLNPNKYMKEKSGNNYFTRLDSILCKHASKNNSEGIVYL